MPKKPTTPKTSTNQLLTFTIRQQPAPDTGEPTEFGCFSRNWDQEEALDQLMDNLDADRINDKQALLHAQKLLAQSPGNLELQNYLANRLWALEMRDEATEVWAKAFKQASALIPNQRLLGSDQLVRGRQPAVFTDGSGLSAGPDGSP